MTHAAGPACPEKKPTRPRGLPSLACWGQCPLLASQLQQARGCAGSPAPASPGLTSSSCGALAPEPARQGLALGDTCHLPASYQPGGRSLEPRAWAGARQSLLTLQRP